MATSKTINAEQLKEAAPFMHAGDNVLLSGVVYTARDAAHARFFSLLDQGAELPFPL